MLKAVLPAENGEAEEKKSDQHDGVVEQYKKIIREQVIVIVVITFVRCQKIIITLEPVV